MMKLGQGLSRRLVSAVAVAAAMAIAAPAAGAAITPQVTLDQSAGHAAGSTANLGVDLTFAPTSGDSPKDMTLTLPAGLLANAAIDGGACLKSTTVPNTACQVGSGTVTANPVVGGLVVPAPVSVPVTFDLVAPPSPSALAGLAVVSNGAQLGSTAAIALRHVGDPAGVGLTIAFSGLPQTYAVPVLGNVPISITEINSTFDSLRYPATCPATPASFGVSADSYADATSKSAGAPLTVTGCSSEPFSPGLKLTAVRDAGDTQAQVTSDITQAAGQAPIRSVKLNFPIDTLSPNFSVAGALCSSPSFAGCQTLGSATATSPLYPTPLAGTAYLTGSLTAPSIQLVFGPPFSLTLAGQISLVGNATTFSGIPDFPLSDLKVTLDGGPQGVFQATCATPTGTATAALTSQNGDETASASSTFTVANCPKQGANSGGSGSAATGLARLTGAHMWGLLAGRPGLGFTVAATKGSPKLRSLTVQVATGLRLVRRRVHKKLRLTGVTVTKAKVKSLALSHGRLVITLKQVSASAAVRIGPSALAQSLALRSKARHRQVKSLRLAVTAVNAKGKRATLRTQITKLGLPSI